MKRSGIIILLVAFVLTVLSIALGGSFWLLISLQPYLWIGLAAVLLVAFLNTRRELAPGSGRGERTDRLCLHFVQILGSCVVCLGLLLTLIGLASAIFCARRFVADLDRVGDIAVSLLPFLYCLAIAEVLCPVLTRHFGCRIERARQAGSDADPNSAA